jgi:L-amino acid N-acyltransferase YncA
VRYPKEVVLKKGQDAVIRPLQAEDASSLRRFYESVPDSDRWYMRCDVLDPAVMKQWIDGVATGSVFSIVAVFGKQIIAHASLHVRAHGATSHLGRLRIMVDPAFRHQRLGTWMLLDLIQLAMDQGLSDLRADFVVGVEDAAIDAARKLDFFETALLKDYVKGPRSNRHDLMIMIKRIHKDWGDF